MTDSFVELYCHSQLILCFTSYFDVIYFFYVLLINSFIKRPLLVLQSNVLVSKTKKSGMENVLVSLRRSDLTIVVIWFQSRSSVIVLNAVRVLSTSKQYNLLFAATMGPRSLTLLAIRRRYSELATHATLYTLVICSRLRHRVSFSSVGSQVGWQTGR